MARRRQAKRSLSPEEVLAILDAEHPDPEWDPAVDDDWQTHVDRAQRVRAARRVILARYGYTTLDMFAVKFPRVLDVGLVAIAREEGPAKGADDDG